MAFLRSPEIGVSLPANAGYALATCGPGGGKSVWFALLVLGAGLLGVPCVWGCFLFGGPRGSLIFASILSGSFCFETVD